jgi:omega-amidase
LIKTFPGLNPSFKRQAMALILLFFPKCFQPVCYDLRFPVWSRNTNDYDILVYVANWPAPRRDAWTALLKARAIENQSFVVGVNRVGDDPKTSYAGESVVFSPKGEVLSAPLNGHPEVISANISLEQLHAFRKKFPAWMDADTFSLDASDLLSMRVL